MASFDIAAKITLAIEGGHTVHSKDNGNWTGGKVNKGVLAGTNYGISAPVLAAYYSRSITPADMNSLTRSVALAIYKKNYWDINKLDMVNDQQVANKLFDIGVNMGVSIASLSLQKALNAMNQNGKYYRDLEVDGKVGPETIKALNKHPKPSNIYKALNVLQGYRYLSIVEGNESQEAFINGWFDHRIATLSNTDRSENPTV